MTPRIQTGSGGGGGLASSDLLLHFDGDLTDELGHSIAGAVLGYNTGKWGGANSAGNIGEGTFPYAEAHADFAIAGQKWAVDAWVKPAGSAGDLFMFSNVARDQRLAVGLYAGTIYIELAGLAGKSASETSALSATLDTWQHFAVAHDPALDLYTVFWDGSQVVELSTVEEPDDINYNIIMGEAYINGDERGLTGLMDEFRCTPTDDHGWTGQSSIAVPTGPYSVAGGGGTPAAGGRRKAEGGRRNRTRMGR